MDVSIVAQPDLTLGQEVNDLLREKTFTEIIFVSAFVSLRTILRLRDQIFPQRQDGANFKLVLGIDLGGTSREVLEELLTWGCEVQVYHNPIARATFHPKLYFFKSREGAILFIGSNNLTDGGFYTNYEVATRYDFVFPNDEVEYNTIIDPLRRFLQPSGNDVRHLSAELIDILVRRGQIPSEAEARQRRREDFGSRARSGDIPPNPFRPVAVALPPLLPVEVRATLPMQQAPLFERTHLASQLSQFLVWSKILPRSDVLQTAEGSNSVGGLRLVQAGFVDDATGGTIDQTVYFRQLFNDYVWQPETGRNRRPDQEHTFVPMRVFLLGHDYGVQTFEISHKPSGEAGQANYTTILRWGEFADIIRASSLADRQFNLYETDDPTVRFMIEVI